MAWHTGKPGYRGNPSSVEVRENFEYLKVLADILSGGGVSAADLLKLAGAVSTPAADKVAVRDTNGLVQGSSIDWTGDVSGESSGFTSSGYRGYDLALGSAKAGDIILVQGHGIITSFVTIVYPKMGVVFSGTAVVDIGYDSQSAYTTMHITPANSTEGNIFVMGKVRTAGTVIATVSAEVGVAAAGTKITVGGRAGYLKKQA